MSRVAHDSPSARQLNYAGIQFVRRGQIDKAEASFKKSIYADQTFGPAHNNLGKIYFRKRKLKLAATAFQEAMQLMPHRAEPVNNLGLAYEASGRINEAIELFEAAHLMGIHNPQYLGNLVRARLKRGDHDDVVQAELRELVFIDVRPEWTKWAEHHLAVSFNDDSGSGEPQLGSEEEGEAYHEEIVTPSPWLVSPEGEIIPPAENSVLGPTGLTQPQFIE